MGEIERRMTLRGTHTLKSAIEAMMFVWGSPLDLKSICQVCDISRDEARGLMEELKSEYVERGGGLRIRQVAQGYQFVTASEYGSYIEKLCTPTKIKKLTQSALEVLALIAYKQPVTKADIDGIRGVKCDRTIEGLMAKGLIEERGRSDSIGRPILYGTTDEFLKKFGFETIKELPDIKAIENLVGMSFAGDSEQIAIEGVTEREENGNEKEDQSEI